MGVLAISRVLALPLKYLKGVPDIAAPVLHMRAIRRNRETPLRYLSLTAGGLLGGFLMIAATPFGNFLWPMILALIYVACREIFMEPSQAEEEKAPASGLAPYP